MRQDSMSSQERLLATFRRQPVDRVPVKVWGAQPAFQTIHPSFDPLLLAALEKTDLVDTWTMSGGVALSGTDTVAVHTEVRDCEPEDYRQRIDTYQTPGGELTSIWYFNDKGKPGYMKKYRIETEEDARRLLSIPYVPIREDVTGFFEKRDQLGQRGIVMVGMNEPMYAINAMMGSETFALWSITHRDLLHELINTMYERIRDRLEYQLQRGVGPVYGYVGPELCIPPLQSPADFQEFVVEYDRKLIDLIHTHDGLVWCHSHGKMGPVLEGFAEMGVDVLNPVEPPPIGDITLVQAKARVGDRVALEGNIEKDEFYRSTPDRIRELVRRAIHEGAPGYGFILCPTSSFQEWSEASPRYVENYLAYIDDGLQAGRYPIGASP